jgi:hypothetical protein
MRRAPKKYRLRRAKDYADRFVQKLVSKGTSEDLENALIRIIGRCDLRDDPLIEQWLRLHIQLELEKAEGIRQKRERERWKQEQEKYLAVVPTLNEE